MRRVFLSGLWLVPMLVWACGGDGPATPGLFGYGGSGPTGLPCDVIDVVKAKCQNCHGAQPLYGSPMPLVTAADFAAPAKSNPNKTVAQLVSERIHDAVSQFLTGVEAFAGDDLAGFLVAEHRNRHAPGALARQHPVRASGDHGVQPVSPSRGDEACVFDCLQ